jgi:hypothetical protein
MGQAQGLIKMNGDGKIKKPRLVIAQFDSRRK